MNLAEHYHNLYQDSIRKIISDEYQIDKLIHFPGDHRLGITLIIRPGNQVKNKIQGFLDELKAIDPCQYYYPDSDIHVTLMSIISCYEGFDLSGISIADYVEVINEILTDQKGFEIEFKGITASPSCIMIQGFFKDDTLNGLRDRLRMKFRSLALQQTIDARYAIQTAHSTVVRFCKPISGKSDFIDVLEKYRDYPFGTFKVNSVFLVCNDWYQRERATKELYTFNLA
ncbi:MAG: mutarotase [Bacteroidota bacterium]|nr:mutarotase [Bacteroidota bacterium]